MPPPRSPNTDRGGATSNAKGGFSGPGVSGLNAPSRSAPSAAAKGPAGGGQKGPAASQAAAKANATKTSNAKPTQTAGRVPGTSAAAAKNTALGRVAQAAQTNARPAVQNPVTFGGQFDNGAAPKFSQKPSWQTRPGADVMGSKPSQQAMNPAKLGLPKSTVTALNKAQTTTSPTQSMGYLDRAAKQIGLNESTKKAALQDYLKTGGINLDPATTAWCAAFVNSTLAQEGLPVQRTADGKLALGARQFLNYGIPTKEPREGDIAVFSRPGPYGWEGHVGFYKGVNPDGSISVLGGNQANAVNVKSYPASRLLGYRQVPGAPAPGTISSQPGLAAPSQIGSIPGSIARAPISATQLASTAPTAIPDAGRAQRNQDALRAVTAPLQQPRMGAFQGPRMPGDPSMPRGIPAPQSTGMMPPSSFIGGTPRANLPPGAFPQAPRLSNVENYLTPGTTVTRNPYEQRAAAQYGGYGTFNTPALTAGLSRAEYDAPRPAPVSRNAFDTQRAAPAPSLGYGPASPLGNMPPAAERPRLVAGNIGGMSFTPPLPGPQKQFYDRVAQTPGPMPQPTLPTYPGASPAGTYTAPYDRAPPVQVAWSVPPLGGALSAEQATGLGVWSTTRRPPAAPHPGTIHSQTAEVQTDGAGQSWGSWIKKKTGVDPVQVKETIVDGQKQLKEAVDTYGEEAVLTYLEQKAGKTPQALKGYGSTMNDNAARYLQQAGANMMMGGPALTGGGGNGPQLTPVQMTELLTAMQAKGATPEEIAYVQSLITQTA